MVSLTLDGLGARLDRSLLHVFVAGPGYGEGIAVALPHSGWLVLDGCRVSKGHLPILAILDRWRSSTEPVDALLLTHPHTDHAFGIRETIEGTAPRRIGVTTSSTSPALMFAAAEAELAAASPGSLDQLRRRTVIDAMLAIRRRFDAAPGEVLRRDDAVTARPSKRPRSGSARPGWMPRVSAGSPRLALACRSQRGSA